MTASNKIASRLAFKTGEAVVYPAHGLGRITAIEEQEVAGFKLELFVVFFEKDKMVLRVPTAKASSIGLRKVAEPELVEQALEVLTRRAKVKRSMWSRRAQEYEAKINSGDLISIAEVVRDLHRFEGQQEPSYSERGIYESALDLLTREISSVNDATDTESLKLIQQSLAKSQRGAKNDEGDADPAEGDMREEIA
jgi:CarD family transcriptional regulator